MGICLGAISGAFTPTGLSKQSMGLISGVLSSLRTLIENYDRTKKLNFQGVFISFISGYLAGLIGGAGMKRALPEFRPSTGTYVTMTRGRYAVYHCSKVIPLNAKTFKVFAQGLWRYVGGMVSSLIIGKL